MTNNTSALIPGVDIFSNAPFSTNAPAVVAAQTPPADLKPRGGVVDTLVIVAVLLYIVFCAGLIVKWQSITQPPKKRRRK